MYWYTILLWLTLTNRLDMLTAPRADGGLGLYADVYGRESGVGGEEGGTAAAAPRKSHALKTLSRDCSPSNSSPTRLQCVCFCLCIFSESIRAISPYSLSHSFQQNPQSPHRIHINMFLTAWESPSSVPIRGSQQQYLAYAFQARDGGARRGKAVCRLNTSG